MADFFKQFGGVSEQEAQAGGGDFFAQFGGTRDAIAPSPVQKDDDPVFSLGKAVMAALKQSMSAASPFEKGPTMGAAESMATPGSAPAEFATGVARGVTRQAPEMGASSERQLGETIGRPALPIAAAIGAGALSGGLSLPATAAMVGLGAGGGEAASQLAARATGGEAPKTSGEAAGAIAKTGLEVAAVELGLGAGALAAKSLAPTAFQVFSKIPAESMKRAIKNPDIVMVGPGAQVKVEIKAAKALRDAQRAMENLRATKGQAVDRALTELGVATKNQAVVDVAKVSKAAKTVLEDASAGDAAIAKTLGGEMKKIRGVLKALDSKQAYTAKDAVNLRRRLDDMIKFKRGGMAEVSSDVGQRTVREMAAALRQSIDEAADAAGQVALKEANRDFSQFVRAYDEVGAEIATKEVTPAALIKQVRKVAAKFNAGPTEARGLESVAGKIPGVSGQMNRLLDLVAARELTKLPRSTPSSSLKDLLLFISAPQAVGAGVKGAAMGAGAGRVARRGVAAGVATE